MLDTFAAKHNLRHQLYVRLYIKWFATDCVVRNTLLDSCTKHDCAVIQDQVLADFEHGGARTSNFTLSILVKMYGHHRQLQKASDVLDTFAAMHNLRHELYVRLYIKWFATDCVVSNTLLGSCTKHDCSVIQDQVLADFEHSGARTSNFTLGILVKMGQHRQLQKGCDVLDTFAAKHHLRHESYVRLYFSSHQCVVYNTVLDSCTKHDCSGIQDQVLADFKHNGARTWNLTLVILVKTYDHHRQMQKASMCGTPSRRSAT